MAQATPDLNKYFSFRRIIWPVLIGLGIVGWLLYRDITNPEHDVIADWKQIEWSGRTFFWLGMGLIAMFLRDIAYMWRMRVVTDRQMSWRACFEVTLLWEFSSAASPSVVGGVAVAVFMFIKEKIQAGRATAIVFVTVLLDEAFYLIMLPLSILWVGHAQVFSPLYALDDGADSMIGTSLLAAFWIAYAVIFVYVLFLGFGLFVRPNRIARLVKVIFNWRLLRRFRRRGFRTADELLISSQEFGKKKFLFWLESGAATFLAWMARYLVLNCVLAAFVAAEMSFHDHVVAFARQAVLFVVMIVSPTPGSSGVAETTFGQLFEDMIVPIGLTTLLALIWRLITYYPYLFVAIPILPRWLRRVYKK
jgi:uncharacterized protein (TIRG00374 family)